MYVIEQCNDWASKIYLVHYKLIDSSLWPGIVYCTCLGVSSYNVLKYCYGIFFFCLNFFFTLTNSVDHVCKSIFKVFQCFQYTKS